MKKNKLGPERRCKGAAPGQIEVANEIIMCDKHGKYRRYQARYSNVTCPTCYQECENDYYRDSKRFSYWPDD